MTADIYKQRISARFMQNTPDFEKIPFDESSAAMGYLRFCFVVLIEAIRVILISRQRFSNRSYSADGIIFVLLNNKSQ